jgi:hypothetical protein
MRLTGMTSKTFHEDISAALGLNYLSDPPMDISCPIKGIVFGVNLRPVIPIIVTHKTMSKVVFFIVDTGSPHTYLSAEALHALNLQETCHSSILPITLHGIKMPAVYLSGHHFSECNVLGAHFLSKGRADLKVNYEDLTVVVTLH